MSHLVTIKTEVRDVAAIRAACRRLNLAEPEQGTFKLFRGEATGVAVRLPDWVYPLVCDVATGHIRYDNFGGRWGDSQELDRFMQSYAVEKCRAEARKRGHAVTEQTLADGAIKLTVQVGGGVA